jgi:hypothetical protein
VVALPRSTKTEGAEYWPFPSLITKITRASNGYFGFLSNLLVLHVAPDVAFTDGDAKMATSIAVEWPTAMHLLCTWHLWKNFYEHLRNKFPKDKQEQWSQAAKMWWRLCKTSDESLKDVFDSKWDDLVSHISESIGVIDDNTQKWLDGWRLPCRHMFAVLFLLGLDAELAVLLKV